ncbi:hypothetical protein R5M92_13485 [Halomonas sp. Bachu 37]|uniref:hypothetical protein n=1 Tax=Halomonas kashgarensis TaxID=3084920 RepID=UPI0032165C33
MGKCFARGFFIHLAGGCEYLLHEINIVQNLRLGAGEVKPRAVRDKLSKHGKSSPAFDYWKAQRDDSGSFLTLLCELRNAGTHRYYLNKVIYASSHSRPDNEVIDPRTKQSQQLYPGLGVISLMESLLKEAQDFIATCHHQLDVNAHI